MSSGATCTWAPGTTTPRQRRSTRISACSPPTRHWAPTCTTSSTSCPALRGRRAPPTGGCSSARRRCCPGSSRSSNGGPRTPPPVGAGGGAPHPTGARAAGGGAGPGWTRSSRPSSTTRRRGSWTPTDRTAAAIRAVLRRSVSRARSSNSWSALARPEARPRGRAVRARGARAGSELRRAALPLDGEGRHPARPAGAGPDHYHSHPDGLGAARSHRAGPLCGSRRPRTHGLWRRRLGGPRRQAQGRPRLAHRADGAAGQSSRLVHRGRDPVAPLWGGVRASARVAGLARRQARDRQERPRRPAAPCPGVRAGVLRRRAPAWREAADSRAARPLQFLDSRPVGDSSRLSRDRARAMTAPTRVYCRAMGPVRVSVNGADAPPELLWRKHLALLAYLARSPRRSRAREHLVGLLWSDRDEQQARHSLSEALRVLRRILGDDQVPADGDQIRLGSAALALDCDHFAERYGQNDWPGAAALVEGDFLEGLSIAGASEFESWLGAERVRWRAQGIDALVRHAAGLLARGDATEAVTAALRALSLDPTSEPAARAAMRSLAIAGDRTAALRVADDLARALREQLGAARSEERRVGKEGRSRWSPDH